MMLRRLKAQVHDYNIKLTKAELLVLASSRNAPFMDFYEVFCKICDLADREAKRLGELP